MPLDPSKQLSLIRFKTEGKAATAADFEAAFGLTKDDYDTTIGFPEVQNSEKEYSRTFFAIVEREAADRIARSGNKNLVTCESYDRQEKAIAQDKIMNFGQLIQVFNECAAKNDVFTSILEARSGEIVRHGIDVDIETGRPFIFLTVVPETKTEDVPKKIGDLELRIRVSPRPRFI